MHSCNSGAGSTNLSQVLISHVPSTSWRRDSPCGMVCVAKSSSPPKQQPSSSSSFAKECGAHFASAGQVIPRPACQVAHAAKGSGCAMYHVEDPTKEHSESGLAVHRAYIQEDVARACLDAMLIFLLLFGLDRTCLQSELDCGDGRFTLPAKFVLILHANAVEGRQSQVELFEPLGVLGRLLTLLNEQGKIVHPILDDRHAMACANLPSKRCCSRTPYPKLIGNQDAFQPRTCVKSVSSASFPVNPPKTL